MLNFLELKTVPINGSCDSRSHIITQMFENENGDFTQLKVESVKSKDNNCLINALQQANGYNRSFKADNIRKVLGLELKTAISSEYCDVIAK